MMTAFARGIVFFAILAWPAMSQDLLNQAWQSEFKGDAAGARDFLRRVIQSSPNNPDYLLAYAQMLERQRSPQALEAYEKADAALKSSNAPADSMSDWVSASFATVASCARPRNR